MKKKPLISPERPTRPAKAIELEDRIDKLLQGLENKDPVFDFFYGYKHELRSASPREEFLKKVELELNAYQKSVETDRQATQAAVNSTLKKPQ